MDQPLISNDCHVLSIWKWLDNYRLFLFAHKAVASLQAANIDCAVAISKQCLRKCIRELVCSVNKLFWCRHISAIDTVQGYIGWIINPDWWNSFAYINGIWILDVKEELLKVTIRIVLISSLDNYLEGETKLFCKHCQPYGHNRRPSGSQWGERKSKWQRGKSARKILGFLSNSFPHRIFSQSFWLSLASNNGPGPPRMIHRQRDTLILQITATPKMHFRAKKKRNVKHSTNSLNWANKNKYM